MNKHIPVATIFAISLLASRAAAHEYQITWYTIDGGGGTSAGGSFELTGTIGQHDASAARVGGTYSHRGGFWTDVNCPADFNLDHAVNSQDFFDFLTAFFGTKSNADFNDDGVVNSQDFFDFLAAFFDGC